MKSMTGHGRGEAVFHGRHITAEVYAVNRKQLEVVFSLPRAFGGHGAAAASFEGPLRELVALQVSRGRVTVAVHLSEGEESAGETHLNEKAAVAHHKQLEALRKKLKIDAPVTLDQVLRGPGVVREADLSLPAEEWLPPVVEAAKGALAAFHKMRAAEGEAPRRRPREADQGDGIPREKDFQAGSAGGGAASRRPPGPPRLGRDRPRFRRRAALQGGRALRRPVAT